MARPLPTPQQVNARWVSAMGQAANAYQAGVDRTTQSPMQAAASDAAMSKYAANTAAAAAGGAQSRMAQKLNSTPIQVWKDGAKIGAGRLATGAQKGAARHMASLQVQAQAWQQQRAAVESVGTGPGTSAARWQASYQAQMAAYGKQAQ